MKRDMDLARNILLKIEGGQKVFETASTETAAMLGFTPEGAMTREEADQLDGHLKLLEQAGFIEIDARMGGGAVLVDGLTWNGHEFLNTIRDEEVWSKTKDQAKKAGTGAIEFVWSIAKDVTKSEIKRRIGFDVG